MGKFPAGTLIEVDDTFGGFRKLAVVTDDGNRFVDLTDCNDASPIQIEAIHSPRELGRPTSWAWWILGEHDEAECALYGAMQDALLKHYDDALAYARACWFAYQNRNYDPVDARGAGEAATQQVRDAHAYLRLRSRLGLDAMN